VCVREWRTGGAGSNLFISKQIYIYWPHSRISKLLGVKGGAHQEGVLLIIASGDCRHKLQLLLVTKTFIE
jgi:hypothetical protein